MFVPYSSVLTERRAGLYLIADTNFGALDDPSCVIYLGRTLSTFHQRIWKHCCKAIGACGNGEPRDTKRWKNYRQSFKSFDTWHFAFHCMDSLEFYAGKISTEDAERAVMNELVQATGSPPVCNAPLPALDQSDWSIIFPWAIQGVLDGWREEAIA